MHSTFTASWIKIHDATGARRLLGYHSVYLRTCLLIFARYNSYQTAKRNSRQCYLTCGNKVYKITTMKRSYGSFHTRTKEKPISANALCHCICRLRFAVVFTLGLVTQVIKIQACESMILINKHFQNRNGVMQFVFHGGRGSCKTGLRVQQHLLIYVSIFMFLFSGNNL